MQGYDVNQSSAAYPLVFLLIGSADHVSPLTGATPAVTISKNGGAFAAPAGAVAEIANGWYRVAGNAADTATLGPLLLHATATGADPTDACYPVVAYNPQAAAGLGLTNLDVNVGSRSTYAGGPVASVTAAVALPAIPANWITAAGIAAGALAGKGDWLPAASYTAPPTVAQISTALWTDTTAGDFATAGSPGKVLMGQLGGAFAAGTSVYTAAALANAPTGTGGGGGLALATVLSAPRAVDGVVDGQVTVNDALWGAICGAAGKETVVGTTYTVMTPSTGTAIRTFTLDSATTPTQRT